MRTIRIGTQRVDVVFCPMEDGDFGEFIFFPTPTIRINNSVPIEIQRLSLLHEMLHAVSEVYGLNLSEAQVRCLEQGLGQTMCEPDVWSFISGNL